MFLTPITKTITSFTLLASLLLSACGQNREIQTTTVQDSSQKTKTASVQNSQQENEIKIPVYRIKVKICEGVTRSLVELAFEDEFGYDGCHYYKFIVWGADNPGTINNDFEPQIVLLLQNAVGHYKFAINSYGCWPENKPSSKSFYLFDTLIAFKDDFKDRKKQIELKPEQFEVQLITKFDDLLSEQIEHETMHHPKTCKKINLPNNS